MGKFDKLKKQLLAEKAEVLERLAHDEEFGLEQSLSDQTGDLSQYDNHPADGGTELFERGKDLALHEQVKNHLRDIDEALTKMENGTYGICEKTGEPIPKERLKANPLAKTIVFKDQGEANQGATYSDRPVEEEVLGGFDRYNYDRDDRETEFDAEDSIQSVSKFNDIDAMHDELGVETATELIGYVEELEGFLSTGLDGYRGTESVHFERNEHYNHYVNQVMENVFQPEGESEEEE